MKHQTRTIPDTKPGTAETYIAEREQKKKVLDKLEQFHTDLEVEKLIAQDNGEPFAIVEAPREIIEHFMRGESLNKFDEDKYFFYRNAAIVEAGTKEAATARIEKSSTLMPEAWLKEKKAK